MTQRDWKIDDPRVLAALRESFGIDGFRSRQAEAVQAVLAGRDVLLTMPTGAGKSLVYQLPAVLLDGLTLVVSPLIALMKDQVDGLRARGLRATFINSSLSAGDRARRLEGATAARFDLLFVTPERFRSPAFREALPHLNVSRLAIDEAHCISHWGHDFRPDYSRLGEYRALLGDPPTIALTATATPKVASDICEHLRMADPLVLRTGIERENLFMAVTPIFEAEEKIGILADRIRRLDGPGIVYSALIKDLEALHSELQRRGVPSLVYHGKLSFDERRAMQERFMASERDVVLATNAFGMGVDKADIRFVIHAQVPRTLESWMQEVGRAGRDGKPSWCELVYFPEDVAIQQNFVNWANPDLEYLVGVYQILVGWGERIQARDLDDLRDELLVKNRGDNRVSICLKWFEVLGLTRGSFETHDLTVVGELDPSGLPGFVGSGDKKRGDLEGLLRMVRFATEGMVCRRVTLAEHFETDAPTAPCGACDVCTRPDAWLAGHFETQRPISAATAPGGADASCAAAAGPSPIQRGDWVRVDGRHIGQVVRVDGTGSRARLLVESATDLRRRTVKPGRAEKL
ncbi:MAG: ATP-dependent DNA helicase RecQ [Chlamydiales bacterium]